MLIFVDIKSSAHEKWATKLKSGEIMESVDLLLVVDLLICDVKVDEAIAAG